MPITPSDIEHKTFSTALRGYDLDEVDDFLDEIVVALRDLHGELTAARAKIAELEQSKGSGAGAVSGTGSGAVVGVGDESAVGRVLILAQQTADRTLEEARAEADRTLEEARVEAERKLEEANAEADRTVTEARTEADSFEAVREQRREAAQTEMAELSVLVASVRNQLALLATTVADKLDEMDSTIDSAGLDAISEEVDDLEGIIDEAGNGAEEAFAELTGAHEVQVDAHLPEVGENAELDLDVTDTVEIAVEEEAGDDLDSDAELDAEIEAAEAVVDSADEETDAGDDDEDDGGDDGGDGEDE